jgi:hypothetical protein
MSYTVVWAAEAECELAALWTSAADRSRIATAADSLDRALSRDPVVVGESRSGSRRIVFCLPLGIRFEIIEGDRMVRVLAVWRVSAS